MSKTKRKRAAANGAPSAMIGESSNTQPDAAQTPEVSWRDFPNRLVVHPCADTFPRIEGTERDAFDKSIREHRLKVPIQTREVAGEPGIIYIIDGRERLDSLERSGIQIVNAEGEWIGEFADGPNVERKRIHRSGATHPNIAREVIDFNIRRRENKQDKGDQLTQMAKVLIAAQDLTPPSEKEFSVTHDQKFPKPVGRPKDPLKKDLLEEAAESDIEASESTITRALAAARPSKTKSKRKSKAKAPKESKPRSLMQSVQEWAKHSARRTEASGPKLASF